MEAVVAVLILLIALFLTMVLAIAVVVAGLMLVCVGTVRLAGKAIPRTEHGDVVQQ